MRHVIVAMLAGVVFAIGLVVSGMTAPAEVIGFLDVGRAWNPALAFMAVGSVGVFAPVVWLARGRPRPVFGDRFHWPTARTIDARLVAGSAVFGVGWGIAGYCPGPSLVSVSSQTDLLVFVATMLVGHKLGRMSSPGA